MSEKSNAVMLPGDVRPVLYDLTLTPDLDSFTFAGEETVEIEVIEETSSVTLNCAEIEVASCRVTAAGVDLAPASISFDEQAETVTFGFDRPLPVGPARLHVEFTGALNDLLRGFYRSRYVDEDGAERYLATTQFEATDARRAFPCWDEPALKAKFRLSLVVPSELAAVSNMLPVSESELPGGLRRVTFGDTPVMSTYLLAFVVGDLRSIERRAPCGALVRVWGTPGKERQGRFALDLSVKLLDYFNGYFGVPYPLEKLDHIAIPDFAAGAMENWGAITYRENALLVDPEQSSAVTRQNVASIVAHEMAHMWFGDLVTMAWWNDLWLNESFASWMGDKSVDFAFPGVGRLDAVRLVRHQRGPEPGTGFAAPTRSSSRSTTRRRSVSYSTRSATARAGRRCACWSSSSARTCSGRASPATYRSTSTATPARRTCGTRWARRRGSRCGR